MPAGIDRASGDEPSVFHRRLVSPKDDALQAARAAGLQVLEGRAMVRKYHGEVAPGNLYEVVESAPNLFLTSGINLLLTLGVGGGGTPWNAANARLCVGDSTTAAAAGQTDLQAATNKYRQVVDGAPAVSSNQVTFVATFPQGVANFAWREVAVANAASGGTCWNRTVTDLGTKSSAASWVLSWTLSIN